MGGFEMSVGLILVVVIALFVIASSVKVLR
jgi:hypothetical protein